MADTSFDINNGANQIAPNAMTQNQYFYGEEFARKILGSKDKPLSLVVLGAGVDATIGLPHQPTLYLALSISWKPMKARRSMPFCARQ